MGEEMARKTPVEAKTKRKPRKVASTAKTATSSKPASKPSPGRGSKPGERRGGRKKGTPNKMTASLKEAILKAAEGAHPKGTVGYLGDVAKKDPRTFCGLLGRVLPMTIAADGDNPLIPDTIKLEIVDASSAGTA